MMKTFSKINKLLIDNKLILASGSPRRVHLLNKAGIEFTQVIPGIEENGIEWNNPYQAASDLAHKKASFVAQKVSKNTVVIGCDTIVVIDSEVLGKPSSPGNALEMLNKLSGNCHTVCTAISLQNSADATITDYELTRVHFNNIDNARLIEYIATGEPLDKAGAYGIQGAGAFLVDRIEGNLDNVIGLPMELLDKLAGRILKLKESNG